MTKAKAAAKGADGGAPHRFILDDLSDVALARVMRTWRRQLEDGDMAEPRVFVERSLARGRQIQLARFRLRMRYGARCRYGPAGDRGTASYDRYMRFDEYPSYELAAAIDRCRAERGQSHVLAWKQEVAA